MYKTTLQLAMAFMSLISISCQSRAQQELTVNPNHRFEISPCEFKYNGKTFCLGGGIQELVDVFGPYDRSARHGYVWDSIGIGVLCHYQTEKTVEMRICFDCCEWTDPKDLEGTLPKICFQGAILVDGIPWGNGKSMDDFQNELRKKGSQITFSYWKLMKDYNYEYDCEYDEVKSEMISDMNHTLIICPNTSTTYSTFIIADSREDFRLEREAKKNEKPNE